MQILRSEPHPIYPANDASPLERPVTGVHERRPETSVDEATRRRIAELVEEHRRAGVVCAHELAIDDVRLERTEEVQRESGALRMAYRAELEAEAAEAELVSRAHVEPGLVWAKSQLHEEGEEGVPLEAQRASVVISTTHGPDGSAPACIKEILTHARAAAPRSLEELSTTIAAVTEAGCEHAPIVDLADQLIRHGAADHRQRALRLARAYRLHVAAVRRDLDRAELFLAAIESGVFARSGENLEIAAALEAYRTGEGAAASPLLPMLECFADAMLRAGAADAERDPLDDFAGCAGDLFSDALLPYGHDVSTASTRYSRAVLAALAGTTAAELRLEEV